MEAIVELKIETVKTEAAFDLGNVRSNSQNDQQDFSSIKRVQLAGKLSEVQFYTQTLHAIANSLFKKPDHVRTFQAVHPCSTRSESIATRS